MWGLAALLVRIPERSSDGPGEKGGKREPRITLYTGASVGDELDGTLARGWSIAKRIPYQTNESIRNSINSGKIEFVDLHLAHMPQMVRYGFLGKIDVAIIEAVAIREDGGIVPSTSVGNSPVFVEMAEKVIVELNESQPLELEECMIFTPRKILLIAGLFLLLGRMRE